MNDDSSKNLSSANNPNQLPHTSELEIVSPTDELTTPKRSSRIYGQGFTPHRIVWKESEKRVDKPEK